MSRDTSTITVSADELGTLAVALLQTCHGVTSYPSLVPSVNAVVWLQSSAQNMINLCKRHGNQDLLDVAGKLDHQVDLLGHLF